MCIAVSVWRSPRSQSCLNTLFLWVCLYMMALNLGSDTSLRSLCSVSDASAGARTFSTHRQKQTHTTRQSKPRENSASSCCYSHFADTLTMIMIYCVLLCLSFPAKLECHHSHLSAHKYTHTVFNKAQL